MKSIEKSSMIRLQDDRSYYYSVEDVSIDVSGDGITISYHEEQDKKFVMVDYMCFSIEMATEIAKAILKLTNKEK